jgi:hypothetical protein
VSKLLALDNSSLFFFQKKKLGEQQIMCPIWKLNLAKTHVGLKAIPILHHLKKMSRLHVVHSRVIFFLNRVNDASSTITNFGPHWWPENQGSSFGTSKILFSTCFYLTIWPKKKHPRNLNNPISNSKHLLISLKSKINPNRKNLLDFNLFFLAWLKAKITYIKLFSWRRTQ